MTHSNQFGKEVFNNGTGIAEMLTYGLFNGVDKMESVIKDTYCKDQQKQIFDIINTITQSASSL